MADEEWAAFLKIIDLLHEKGYLLFRKEFNPIDPRHCAEFCFLGLQ